jgi:FkbM family methyltransferase
MGVVSVRLRDAVIIGRLGRAPVDRAKLASAHLGFPLIRRMGVPLRFRANLTNGARLQFADDSDLLVLKELLAENEYDLEGVSEPTTILDLGANIGIAALLFRQRYPQAKIICVEASPKTYGRLVRNVSGDPRIETINAAVAGTSGSVSFTDDQESWANHISSDGPVTVRSVTIDELVERYEVSAQDLIKIDIEGAEFDAIGASKLLGRAGSILGEVHPGVGDPQSLFSQLEANGWVMDRPLRRHSFRFIREPRLG